MKFIRNNDISPLKFKGCDKVFKANFATVVEDEEYENLKKNSSIFNDMVAKELLVISDEMRMDWLPTEEQLTEANRINMELSVRNANLEEQIKKKDKEIDKLVKKLEKLEKEKDK